MANHLQLDGGLTIEYQLAPNMVIFSHGFGVRRDARRLFTDIANALPVNYGYILFDYYDYGPDGTIFTTIADQQARLQAVFAWLQNIQPDAQLNLVAHSIGCVIAALVAPPNLTHVCFLAPPLAVGGQTRAYFTGKEGSFCDEQGVWHVPRTDGSISLIPSALFDEMEAINAEHLLHDFAVQQPLLLVTAGNDQVLSDTDYTQLSKLPTVIATVIPNASHDFAEAARAPLVDCILKTLRS
ncbi:MAG TPA: alpha/beta hydrolase [Candidatus Saccharimonadales bacterium]|nr:alpha/beta hydrolase [Candidatus Saccharimonadales bacterium]